MPLPSTITAAELVDLTGLTDERHRQLAKAGHFPSPVQGKYQATATIQGVLKYYREKSSRLSTDYAQNRARKMQADADRVELANAVRKGELMDKADFLARFEPIFVQHKQAILNSSLTDSEKDSLLTELSRIYSI